MSDSTNLTPTFRAIADVAILLLEGGTPEGRSNGRALVLELGQALDSVKAGCGYAGKHITVEAPEVDPVDPETAPLLLGRGFYRTRSGGVAQITHYENDGCSPYVWEGYVLEVGWTYPEDYSWTGAGRVYADGDEHRHDLVERIGCGSGGNLRDYL